MNWKAVSEAIKSIFFLSEKVNKNSADIKELQREVQRLSLAIEMLIQELRHVCDQERVEREKLALQMENELLRRLGPRS